MSNLYLPLIIPFLFFSAKDAMLSGNISGNDLSGTSVQQTVEREMPIKVFRTDSVSDIPLFVYITGDGGWNKFSSALCNYINQKGIPVVALDAQKYFWESKSPEKAAVDLTCVIEKYLKEWKKERFVVAGFSFGADIVPFLLNRFPAEIQTRAVSSILISPDKTCDFEIHLTDMLSMGISKGKYNVPIEIQKSVIMNFTVVFGSDESENAKHSFQLAGVKMKILQGNHHFDSEYAVVADLILKEIADSTIR